MGTPKLALSAEYQTLSSTKADYTDCRDECLSSVHNDLNCWAARYDSSTCVLYFSSDPFLFRDTANIDISSHQLFLKDCYISKYGYLLCFRERLGVIELIVTRKPQMQALLYYTDFP